MMDQRAENLNFRISVQSAAHSLVILAKELERKINCLEGFSHKQLLQIKRDLDGEYDALATLLVAASAVVLDEQKKLKQME